MESKPQLKRLLRPNQTATLLQGFAPLLGPDISLAVSGAPDHLLVSNRPFPPEIIRTLWKAVSDAADATEVIIRTAEKEIVIANPSVSKVNMMGQQTYQVVGEEQERPLQEEDSAPDISEDDVRTVMAQAGCDSDTAKKAIEEHEGDLAEAILSLSKEE